MTAFYLGFSGEETGCAICNEQVASGLAGFVDDNPPHPVCYACLGKSDARLTAVLMLVAFASEVNIERSDSERYAGPAGKLLQMILWASLPTKADRG